MIITAYPISPGVNLDDIKIAPAHEVRDVATGHRHRADVIEDSRLVQLVEERSRLSLQCRLPRRELDVVARFSHER
jgi:hypothetical protein